MNNRLETIRLLKTTIDRVRNIPGSYDESVCILADAVELLLATELENQERMLPSIRYDQIVRERNVKLVGSDVRAVIRLLDERK